MIHDRISTTVLTVTNLFCCTLEVMNCTNRRLGPVATLINRRDYYIDVIEGVGYIILIIVVICYSAIIGKLAFVRWHPQIFPISIQVTHNQRREIRLAIQFSIISMIFFCTAVVNKVQTSAIESQLGLYFVLLLMMSIDTPLLCICNPILRTDIWRAMKCGRSSGSKKHTWDQINPIKLNFNKLNQS